jgi:hypothetical protein
VRYNPTIKPLYDRLRERGKPGKLALEMTIAPSCA